ncbi:hypothetical protein Ancab_005921 [Ancistrocladus abbreviatus]
MSGIGQNLVFFRNARIMFDLDDLMRSLAEVLGEGLFGTANKAVLESGTVIEVKRLKGVAIAHQIFKDKLKWLGQWIVRICCLLGLIVIALIRSFWSMTTCQWEAYLNFCMDEVYSFGVVFSHRCSAHRRRNRPPSIGTAHGEIAVDFKVFDYEFFTFHIVVEEMVEFLQLAIDCTQAVVNLPWMSQVM